MMTRTATLVLLLLGTTAGAQSIDYDPRRAVELRSCDEHRYRGRTEQARTCYTKLLESQTPIVEAEAAWALGDIQRANQIFRDAVQSNERAVQPRVRWARLFLQTHQYSDAADLFNEALKVFPNDVHAKLGLASVYAERFEGQARPLVEDALKQDSDLVEGHLLTASMDLEEGQLDDAEKALDRAMRVVNKDKLPPLEVYTLRASLEMSRGGNPDQWIKRILDYNPRYGAVYQQLAHFEIMRRRYKEATVLLRRAVEVQPDLWAAHAELGSNLLRLGIVDEARTHLQAAYSGDPYSPTTVNSLRLLDRIDEFSISEDPVVIGPDTYQVRLRLHKKESEILRPYVLDLTGRSIQSFTQRYGFKPRETVTVELYPDHDDFAVRVAALPGIGLLGVTFGYVVAMDSPSSRSTSEFHWGSTLWHEMAHVFTLELTDHYVPRWLSEGISVFEEWRTGPTPGVVVPPEAIAALEKKQFLPVADLDSGFIRPSYPGQVQVSYMQSGLVCLFIEQRWGFEQLGALLRQFDGKRTTAQAIEATFKIAPAAFDKEFDAFVRNRFQTVLANFEDWQKQQGAAGQAIQKQRWADAIEPARRAVALYPEHVGGDSPHLMLAKALDKLNRRPEAIAALEAYHRAGGWDPLALRELSRWLDEAGRAQEATDLMVSLNYSDPLNADVHSQLGERLLTAGRAEEALREFQALLALNTLDEAPAHYGMARALREMGDKAGSRRHLLDALATAPHFKPAQALLLKMIEERT
ncbi:tetratricopeptide repeat protein [Peristeroidobacter soli]|uniref:tetratricopeptide repeat protein n=1 Tax=Peristeroidobacter soli TaxID=2497877 RepID=UPI00101C028E|nr:tetratricopeptide repeat protein [Peristeroidobacter soli]